MRFGRGTAAEDDADVCIDLRERLAPYTGEALALDEAPEDGELTPTLTAPLARAARERRLRATPYQPRHLAP